jgi:hypothetical protein
MIARMVLAVGVALAMADHAVGAFDPAARCEADKNRIAGRYLACRHSAIAKGIRDGGLPDFSRCASAFARKWQAAEAQAGAACPTVGDEAAIRAMFDQSAAAAASLLAGPPAPGLLFSGYRWIVKQSDFPVGPGPNRFSDRREDVGVDAAGLHLTIAQHGGVWWSTEVILDANLGYGTYVFHTESRIDTLDANAVLGLFTWDDLAPPYYREIDFEFARWGNPADVNNAQYVVQPYGTPGNLVRFRVALTDQDKKVTHVLVWSPGQVKMSTYRGHHPPGALPPYQRISSWTNNGPHVPAPGAENVRMNLWLVNGVPPLNGQAAAVSITNFLFVP